jgi:hypothetical protein
MLAVLTVLHVKHFVPYSVMILNCHSRISIISGTIGESGYRQGIEKVALSSHFSLFSVVMNHSHSILLKFNTLETP